MHDQTSESFKQVVTTKDQTKQGYHHRPVTNCIHLKPTELEQNLSSDFGMPRISVARPHKSNASGLATNKSLLN